MTILRPTELEPPQWSMRDGFFSHAVLCTINGGDTRLKLQLSWIMGEDTSARKDGVFSDSSRFFNSSYATRHSMQQKKSNQSDYKGEEIPLTPRMRITRDERKLRYTNRNSVHM